MMKIALLLVVRHMRDTRPQVEGALRKQHIPDFLKVHRRLRDGLALDCRRL